MALSSKARLSSLVVGWPGRWESASSAPWWVRLSSAQAGAFSATPGQTDDSGVVLTALAAGAFLAQPFPLLFLELHRLLVTRNRLHAPACRWLALNGLEIVTVLKDSYGNGLLLGLSQDFRRWHYERFSLTLLHVKR